MSTHPPFTCAPRWRWSWKPPAAITAGATAPVAWFEETIATAAELIGVALIFIMAGLIYLFNVHVFKSAAPKADDRKEK